MRVLDFDAFARAWATYWGRRDLGIVVDDSFARRAAESPAALRTVYEHWLAAVRAYPEDTGFRLLGTPELSPGLIVAGGARPVGDLVPGPAAFGAYATGAPAGAPQSERAGDYEVASDPGSEGARAGRTLRLGFGSLPLSALALVGAWWLPAMSGIVAVYALVVSILVSRLYFSKRVRLRTHWPLLATQLVAVAAIAVSVVALVPHSTVPAPPSKETSAMSQPLGDQTLQRILGRLRAHWPSIEAEFIQTASDPVQSIIVRVSDHVLLEATHPGAYWSVRPMTDTSGSLLPLEPDHPYTIGLDASASPEDVADRFYEEIYYWWTKLHPVRAPGEGLPA
jgi:hypothetical protein